MTYDLTTLCILLVGAGFAAGGIAALLMIGEDE